MIIAEVVELILLLIVSMIFNQFFPCRIPIKLANAADNNNIRFNYYFINITANENVVCFNFQIL